MPGFIGYTSSFIANSRRKCIFFLSFVLWECRFSLTLQGLRFSPFSLLSSQILSILPFFSHFEASQRRIRTHLISCGFAGKKALKSLLYQTFFTSNRQGYFRPFSTKVRFVRKSRKPLAFTGTWVRIPPAPP